MKVHRLQQGSPEWLAHRAQYNNASDAPAMMGCSPYKTRTELLDERARGFAAEVDVATQKRFDNGHRAEALARLLAEEIIGEPLYPVVGSEGRLAASFDGLTVLEDKGLEHKALNAELRAAFDDMQTIAPEHRELAAGKTLPLHYRVQMEQQLLVSGAERILFMSSQWDAEGTLIEERHCWYFPDLNLRAQIVAGWAQFERDLATHLPAAVEAKPIGATPETLPALRIEISGAVTASNLEPFKAHALAVIGAINRDLHTDQDFADAEATVKWCKGVEDKLAAAKANALAQTETIEATFRAIDDVSAELKRTRLELDKLVTARKETIRTEIVMNARTALCQHVADLNATLPRCIVQVPTADFAGAVKGKRNVDSIRDAVDALLAGSKAEATQTALRVRANLDAFNLLAADRVSLFPDLNALALKPAEDFSALVQGRLAQHEAELKAAQERAAAEAARREAEQKLAAEQAAARAADYARREAEAAELRARTQKLNVAAPAMATPAAAPAVKQSLTAAEPATLKLGVICERLGFTVSAVFLAETLHISPAKSEGASKLYTEGQFARICQQLQSHISAMAELYEGEAQAS